MKTKFIEAVSEMNWGKFMVAQFDNEEWSRRSSHPESPTLLLRQIGWDHRQIIVFDLQTCEGAAFTPGGFVKADLDKHAVWVCLMYEPFLEWLYKQDLSDIDKLPSLVKIPPEVARKHEGLYGYRRPGPKEEPVVDLTKTQYKVSVECKFAVSRETKQCMFRVYTDNGREDARQQAENLMRSNVGQPHDSYKVVRCQRVNTKPTVAK